MENKQKELTPIQKMENIAVKLGDNYADMMERAGKAAADWICQQSEVAPDTVVIVCGGGNNGGDGYVMARYLLDVVDVTVVSLEETSTTEDAQKNRLRLQEMVGTNEAGFTLTMLDWKAEKDACCEAIRMASILVDAIFGVGFHGELPKRAVSVLKRMNDSRSFRVALDMPSGVEAETGKSVRYAFRADYTLAFAAAKRGSVSPASGTVEVLDIGIPFSLAEQYTGAGVITEDMVKRYFKARKVDSHKGDYGRLLAICGSYGMAGAALLCARAALRCGVGLVTLAVPRSVYPLLAAAQPEAVFLPLPETEDGVLSADAIAPLLAAMDKATAVVMGCGLGTGEQLTDVVMSVLKHATCPVILDADGINAIKPHMLLEETISAPLVLTPHPGEMARLLGITIEEVQENREETARNFAEKYGVAVTLKGHDTVVAAPHGRMLRNPVGNPGMATGGSGDVLAGMIGSFAAQGMSGYDAALCGVYIHGAAGDKAAVRLSQRYMLPTDIIGSLTGRFLEMEE